jgi:6-methylpretetramide 4-monooxygenase
VNAEVVVVGAGGGGAVLGLILAQAGVRVSVLERQVALPTMPRAETIQPNGQQILHRLGILEALTKEAVEPVRRFHFLRIGGSRLCSVDYGTLPPPWNRALVALSNRTHELILARLSAQPTAEVRYGVEFKGLKRRDGSMSVLAGSAGDQATTAEIECDVVVGADGAFSKVREALSIRTALHRYRHGYLIALLPRPEGMQGEARYHVGRGELLGMFPAPGDRVVLLSMIEAEALDAVRDRGLQAFNNRIAGIDPAMRLPLESLTAWQQVGFLPCVRVRAERWVADRAALIGDAAHAMNPHVSQGRMQAMADAAALAEVILTCRKTRSWSAEALSAYEKARRPQVAMLQRLADEQTLLWNAADPVRTSLRDRVFRGLDRNPRLRYQVLTATAGLRPTPPLTWIDKLMAVGLLPDPHADELPST